VAEAISTQYGGIETVPVYLVDDDAVYIWV
jgi:hypothetical protein